MANHPEDELVALRLRAKQQFGYFAGTRCPYFQNVVRFNSIGFQHLRFKSWNRTRKCGDQVELFSILIWAAEVIRLSRTVQGITTFKKLERFHRHGQWVKELVTVTYYVFYAVFDGRRVKVIVRRINDGIPYFWSVTSNQQSKSSSRLKAPCAPRTKPPNSAAL